MITCDTNSDLNCERPTVIFLSFFCGKLSYGTSADKCMVFWGWFPHLKIWFVAKVSDSNYLVIWIDLCSKYRHKVLNFSSPVAIMTWDAFSVGAPVMSGSRLLRVTHREIGVAKWLLRRSVRRSGLQVRSGLHVKCWVRYATKNGLTHNTIELYATGYHALKGKRKLNILW